MSASLVGSEMCIRDSSSSRPFMTSSSRPQTSQFGESDAELSGIPAALGVGPAHLEFALDHRLLGSL
eukprot:1523384-Alexandrium_andersonii.AAC.1